MTKAVLRIGRVLGSYSFALLQLIIADSKYIEALTIVWYFWMCSWECGVMRSHVRFNEIRNIKKKCFQHMQ